MVLPIDLFPILLHIFHHLYGESKLNCIRFCLHETNPLTLQFKAKNEYEVRKVREEVARQRGEHTWMLSSVEVNLDSSKKKKKKKEKKKKKKKQKKSKKSKKHDTSSSVSQEFGRNHEGFRKLVRHIFIYFC